MEFLLDALLDALTLTYFDRASCAQHDFWYQAHKLRKSHSIEEDCSHPPILDTKIVRFRGISEALAWWARH